MEQLLEFCAYGNLDVVIGEDERRVGRCQLCGRHCDDVCDLSRAKVLRLERGLFVVGMVETRQAR